METCIFCGIIGGSEPAHKLWESDDFLAFLSMHPCNPGHACLVPKPHVDYVFDLDGPLYFRLALLALGNYDTKALDYVGKIGDNSFREQARSWVEWVLILKAVEKKKPDDALEFAGDGKLTHVQRVWVLTQSAKLLAKSDREKALLLLDKGRAAVRLIGRGDATRPRCLLAIANAVRLIDPPQVWDAVSDAVEAANWIEDFTGEGGEITRNLSSKSQILTKTEAAPDFDIRAVFGGLASVDLDHAIQVAQTFKGEAARTNAILSISQSILSEKNAAAPHHNSRRKSSGGCHPAAHT